MAYRGTFRPINYEKYRGNVSNITYRSRWELKLMMHLDSHPDVLEWASEEIIIPYRSPLDGKIHRYFPDFYVKKKNANGIIEKVLIEVKPAAQVKPPMIQETKTRKPSKKYINEVATYAVNQAKWKAAENYCLDRQWRFMIMTEKELGIKF